METIIYKINFFTYWHTGSGLSGGVDANLAVIKNEDQLPFIPGKTLKGLLREAASTLNGLNSNMVSEEFIATVFGVGEDKVGEEFSSGNCFFSNALLSGNLISYFQGKKEDKEFLFKIIASTAINENGIAKNQSLRQMEVTVPLTLYATIEGFPNDVGYLEQLQYCFQWIKKIGVNRTRGLGYCELSYLKPESR